MSCTRLKPRTWKKHQKWITSWVRSLLSVFHEHHGYAYEPAKTVMMINWSQLVGKIMHPGPKWNTIPAPSASFRTPDSPGCRSNDSSGLTRNIDSWCPAAAGICRAGSAERESCPNLEVDHSEHQQVRITCMLLINFFPQQFHETSMKKWGSNRVHLWLQYLVQGQNPLQINMVEPPTYTSWETNHLPCEPFLHLLPTLWIT